MSTWLKSDFPSWSKINLTYIDAAWRLDSPKSWPLFEGILSSTGEMKPSASSSSWSKKLRMLKSVFIVTVKSGFPLLSSSEPSSSSYRETQCPQIKTCHYFLQLKNVLLFHHMHWHIDTERGGQTEQAPELLRFKMSKNISTKTPQSQNTVRCYNYHRLSC